MSQENVEVVRGIQPGPDVDFAALIRDDTTWAGVSQAAAPLVRHDFKAAGRTLDEHPQFLQGLEGLRSVWLDWLQPWASYHAEIEDVIDIDGERVLVLTHDYARPHGSNAEVRLFGTALWTVRDGKIAAAEFFANRAEALKAVGLAG
jgi:hypothetical protein